jgi:hypothetical protein
VVYCPERLPSFFYKKCVKGTTDKSIFPPIFASQIFNYSKLDNLTKEVIDITDENV